MGGRENKELSIHGDGESDGESDGDGDGDGERKIVPAIGQSAGDGAASIPAKARPVLECNLV